MARLVRFYGGTLQEWAQLPLRVVQAMTKAMIRISTEDRLSQIQAALAPHMATEDRGRLVRNLTKIADGDQPRARMAGDQLRAAIAASGIGIQEVRRA